MNVLVTYEHLVLPKVHHYYHISFELNISLSNATVFHQSQLHYTQTNDNDTVSPKHKLHLFGLHLSSDISSRVM